MSDALLTRRDRVLRRVAQLGVLVFVVGYAVAVPLYPGGSPFDRSHPGYHLADNYLCDAFRARAYDGRPNVLGARFGQAGMFGLVFAAASALALAPSRFATVRPRLAATARVCAAIAFAGMLLVPLTPAHEYGVLHFAAVGFAAVPSLVATLLGGYGILSLPERVTGADRALRRGTLLAALVCLVHFAQYAAQASGLVPETPWLPRAQKLVVLCVVAWIVLLTSVRDE